MTDTDLHADVDLEPTSELIPYSNNPKEHPDEQVKKIASSIKNYGWDQPIVVDGDGEIIKGHGRLQAADLLGLEEVPVIRRGDLSSAEARASRIADNRTAESAWIDDTLAAEVDVLSDMDDIEMDSLGFDDDEIEDLLDIEDDGVDELAEPELEDKALEDVRILNLYAGIGGNRFLWGDKPHVTAVEYNERIAAIYEDLHPDDSVVVGDAHRYLAENFEDFDIIWTSPPCPTHSHIRNVAGVGSGSTDPVYPDMKLYEEIIFLQNVYRSSGPDFDGKYIVENVTSYYDPLIEPVEFDRHYFWTNFDLHAEDIEKGENIHGNEPERVEEWLGIDLSGHDFPDDYGRQKILNNVVHPKMGKSILESALDTNL